MKTKELLVSGLVYWAVVTALYFATRTWVADAAGCSQAGGTVAAVLTGIWFYQSRNRPLAPLKVKLAVGATIAVFSVVHALAFQMWLKWMDTPDIAIFFGAVGAMLFPFMLWSTFGKGVKTTKPKQI